MINKINDSDSKGTHNSLWENIKYKKDVGHCSSDKLVFYYL